MQITGAGLVYFSGPVLQWLARFGGRWVRLLLLWGIIASVLGWSAVAGCSAVTFKWSTPAVGWSTAAVGWFWHIPPPPTGWLCRGIVITAAVWAYQFTHHVYFFPLPLKQPIYWFTYFYLPLHFGPLLLAAGTIWYCTRISRSIPQLFFWSTLPPLFPTSPHPITRRRVVAILTV